MQCRLGVGFRQDLGDNTEQNDTEGVGDGDNRPEQYAVPSSSLGAYHVSGDQGFSVTGLKGMRCTDNDGS